MVFKPHVRSNFHACLDKPRQDKTRHLQVIVDSEISIVSTARLNPILSVVLKPLVRSNFHARLDKTRQDKTRHFQFKVDSEISIVWSKLMTFLLNL